MKKTHDQIIIQVTHEKEKVKIIGHGRYSRHLATESTHAKEVKKKIQRILKNYPPSTWRTSDLELSKVLRMQYVKHAR